MTTRRGFLTGILALGAAPAIVRAESLMRLWVPPQELVTLDMLRQVKAELLANVGHPADQFVFFIHPTWEDIFFIHPTWEEATRELIGCGSATVVISREVLRHG